MTTGTATGLEYETREGGVVRFIINGRLDAESIGSLWTQIVGKTRLAQTPWLNHPWHVK